MPPDFPNSGQAWMRSPSEHLTECLTSSGLCTRAEIDYCESFVRQLCGELPDFDSVWLDALVQQSFLTPWQADQIQSNCADRLIVGRFQCQQRLGKSTFLARDPNRNVAVVLKSLAVADDSYRTSANRRLEELIPALDRSRNSAPASLVLPTEVVAQHNSESPEQTDIAESFIVAPFIPGWSMEELLIRGGRLPAPVVAEIGRELLSALAWLESVRLLHGDVVTRNVRLDPRGGVCLTTPFVRRLLQPQFAFTAQLTLRDCEGTAPEQVGTGRTADSRSELYSLGCLLWQLLTSRPVVLTADPVSRLMKQKEHDISDVRGPVPDCPEWMSRIILSMTRRSPELRPASAEEVLKQWRKQSGNSRSQCRLLAKSMPDHSGRSKSRPVVRSIRAGRSWAWPAAATAVLATLVFVSARSGVLPKTLRMSSLTELKSRLSSSEKTVTDTLTASAEIQTAAEIQIGPLPLPDVDSDGIIRLSSGISYLADSREFPGSLRIICEQSPTATILVSAESGWQLRARSVELRGIRVAFRDPVDSGSEPGQPVRRSAPRMLAVQCASLAVTNCVIQSPAFSDEFEGISWLRAAQEEGVVIIRNTVFAGGGYGVSLNHPPRRFELDNVLLANRGGGVLCEFQKGDPDTWDMFCRNVTQRFGFGVLDTVVHDNGIRHISVNVTSSECVYAPQMAILRLRIPETWGPEAIHVQLRSGESGNPAVVPPTTQPVVYIDPRLQQPVSLPEGQVSDTSLLLAELQFDETSHAAAEGTDEGRSEWAGSVLLDFEGPKLTPLMPGIDVGRLPRRD